MSIAMTKILNQLAEGERLPQAVAEEVMDLIMVGEATGPQIGALLMALRMRGESPEEISGFARSMRRHALPVAIARRPIVDTCGTGGDGSHSFNISTVAALVAAGAGASVVKHGNRAASSKSGSADLLEALGIQLSPEPSVLIRMVEETGFGFLFAQSVHTAMRYAAPVRRDLGIRTVFNLLGPLTNPAVPEFQVIGVFDASRIQLMAEALVRLNVDRALVVHGDGLDEVTLSGVTQYALVDGGNIVTGEWTPEDFGLPGYSKSSVIGGDPTVNAEICLRLLAGEPGPYLDVVLANAGVALYAARMVDSPCQGVRVARESVTSGSAARVLARLQELSGGARTAS